MDDHQPDEHQRYLSADEVAHLLRVSMRTLRRWRTLRVGPPGVKVGRSYIYQASGVMGWLRSQAELDWLKSIYPPSSLRWSA